MPGAWQKPLLFAAAVWFYYAKVLRAQPLAKYLSRIPYGFTKFSATFRIFF